MAEERARCAIWCPVCGYETGFNDSVAGAEDELVDHNAEAHPEWVIAASSDGTPTFSKPSGAMTDGD